MCTKAADGLSLGEGHLLKHLPRYDLGCQGGGGVKGNLCVSQVPAPCPHFTPSLSGSCDLPPRFLRLDQHVLVPCPVSSSLLPTWDGGSPQSNKACGCRSWRWEKLLSPPTVGTGDGVGSSAPTSLSKAFPLAPWWKPQWLWGHLRTLQVCRGDMPVADE